MIQIGNVPNIVAVKTVLDELQSDGLVKSWELPYENLLTRLTAAIFFLNPSDETHLPVIWERLAQFPRLSYRENSEQKLSDLSWRVTFDKDFEL
ncbi:MAG: hypothetical protein AAFP19_17580 [Bacteroidota bacterium]